MSVFRNPSRTAKSPNFALWIIVASALAFACGRFFFPPSLLYERLWLEWAGNGVLAAHQIPTRLGPESLTGNGRPWLAQEWLFATIVALANRSALGNTALNLMMAGFAVLPLLVTTARLRARAVSSAQIATALAILALVLDSTLQIRANVLATAAFSLAFMLLEKRDRRVYWLPFLVLVTVNIHASGLFLALLPLSFAVMRLFENAAESAQFDHLWPAALLSVTASFVTPFGGRLWTYAIKLSTDTTTPYIAEWQPLIGFRHGIPYVRESGVIVALLVMTLAIYGANRKAAQITAGESALMAVTLVMGCHSLRFVPLFFLVAVPLIFRAELLEKRLPAAYIGGCLFTALGLTVGSSVTALHYLVSQPGTYEPIRGAVRSPRFWSLPYLYAEPRALRVFCIDFSACNVFLRAGSSVNVDGRIDAYSEQTWKQIVAVSYGRPGWQRVFTDLRINVVVLPARTPASLRMAHLAGWQTVYEDRDQTVFMHQVPGNRERPARGNTITGGAFTQAVHTRTASEIEAI